MRVMSLFVIGFIFSGAFVNASSHEQGCDQLMLSFDSPVSYRVAVDQGTKALTVSFSGGLPREVQSLENFSESQFLREISVARHDGGGSLTFYPHTNQSVAIRIVAFPAAQQLLIMVRKPHHGLSKPLLVAQQPERGLQRA